MAFLSSSAFRPSFALGLMVLALMTDCKAVEVVIHTILCIRQVYPPTSFTRRRAHGVPVYQSRHPQVRAYIAEVVSHVGKELLAGNAKRVTIVIKTWDTGLPLERFVIDFGYLAGDKRREAHQREAQYVT